MNKNDMIRELSAKYDVPVEKTKHILNDFLNWIGDEMAGRNRVQLTGFGTFEAREVNERTSRNPHTGEEIIVPAHYSPKFKAGKQLKEKVAGKQE